MDWLSTRDASGGLVLLAVADPGAGRGDCRRLWLTPESGRIGIAAECRNGSGRLEYAIGCFKEWARPMSKIVANPELAEEREAADVPADRGSAVALV
jgi:hypothetical protein